MLTNLFSPGVSTTFRHWTASNLTRIRDEHFRSSGGNGMKRISAVLSLLLWTAGTAPAQEQQMLHGGWLIQSSAKVGNDGAAISAVAYQPTGWYRAFLARNHP